MIINKINIEKNIVICFVIISFFSGVIGYLSYILDNQVIKVWKEIYILFLSLCILLFNINKLKYIRMDYSFIFTLGAGIFFCIEIFNSIFLDVPIFIMLYQLKNDLLLYIFFIVVQVFVCSLSKEQLKRFSEVIIKIILLLGFVNAIFMILETILFEQFLNLLGLDMGNWGVSLGVKIVVSGSWLRPIGLQSGFVQAATLILFCFFIANENKIYVIKNRIIKYLLNSIFIIAICLSTYATAIVGLIIYITIKYIFHVNKLKENDKKHILYFLFIIIFVLFFYTTHSMGIYEIINEFYPDKAETSILFRIIQHLEIINSCGNNINSLFWGLGLGINGIFGIDKELYGLSATALDSTYIYLFSNYGMIGVLFFVLIMIYFILFFCGKDVIGMKYMGIYILFIEFFFNNSIVNFPVNFLFLLLLVLNLRFNEVERR